MLLRILVCFDKEYDGSLAMYNAECFSVILLIWTSVLLSCAGEVMSYCTELLMEMEVVKATSISIPAFFECFIKFG